MEAVLYALQIKFVHYLFEENSAKMCHTFAFSVLLFGERLGNW